jgi:hypothetical protein
MMRPAATQDPTRAILNSALAGELDAKKLDKLIVDAVQQQQIANYRQELRTTASGCSWNSSTGHSQTAPQTRFWTHCAQYSTSTRSSAHTN